MAFERVYSVLDYYDGPRAGIANFQGEPHYFICGWDERTGAAEDFVL